MFRFRSATFLHCALFLCLSSLAIPVRAQNAGFVYTANLQPLNSGQPSTILGYAIDVHTGGLTAVAGSPFQVPLASRALAVTPSGKFLYAAVPAGSNPYGGVIYGIAGYSIDGNTGALTPVSGSPFPFGTYTGTIVAGLTVDQAGKFLFAYDSFDAQMWVFTIDANTGALTLAPNAPYFDSRLSRSFLAMSPTGQFFYFFSNQYGSGNQINAFQFSQGTESFAAVAGSPFSIPGDPSSGYRNGAQANWATTDPNGGFLYVGDTTQKDLWAYTIDSTSGALTLTPNSPMHIPHNSNQFTVHPSGRFGYLSSPYPDSANCANYFPYTDINAPQTVFAYTVTAASGALSPLAGSPIVAAGYEPNQVAIDPSGRFAYVLDLQGYNFDTTTSNISEYTIDPGTGALQPVLGSPFVVGANVTSLVVAVPSIQ